MHSANLKKAESTTAGGVIVPVHAQETLGGALITGAYQLHFAQG
jgi:hypothetical protein